VVSSARGVSICLGLTRPTAALLLFLYSHHYHYRWIAARSLAGAALALTRLHARVCVRAMRCPLATAGVLPLPLPPLPLSLPPPPLSPPLPPPPLPPPLLPLLPLPVQLKAGVGLVCDTLQGTFPCDGGGSGPQECLVSGRTVRKRCSHGCATSGCWCRVVRCSWLILRVWLCWHTCKRQ
jgi:hypothetical protein